MQYSNTVLIVSEGRGVEGIISVLKLLYITGEVGMKIELKQST